MSCSSCFSRVLMLMSCERSSLSYQRSFLAVSICRQTELLLGMHLKHHWSKHSKTSL